MYYKVFSPSWKKHELFIAMLAFGIVWSTPPGYSCTVLGCFSCLYKSVQPKTWGNPHETLQASLSVSLPHLQCSVPKILAVFLWIVYPLNLLCSKHACLKSSSLRCGLETASIHLICENIGLTLFNFQVSQFCSACCPMSVNPCFLYFACFSVCFYF